MLYRPSARPLITTIVLLSATITAHVEGQSIEQKIGFATGAATFDIQAFTPTANENGVVTLDVQLGGDFVTLELHRFSLRTPDFQLATHDADGKTTIIPAPPVHTFRGSIAGQPGSRIAAMLARNQLTGLIRDGGGLLWCVEPRTNFDPAANPADHVVFAVDSVTLHAGVCGVDATSSVLTTDGAPRGSNTSCDPIVANLAIVGDFEFYQFHGSSLSATIDAIETIVNAMTYIYEEELGITYNLVRIDVWSGGNPFVLVPDVNGEIDHNLYLDTFKNWYNANLPGVNRRFAHLFSGQNFQGGVIRLAAVGTPCNVGGSYGIDQMNSNNLVRNAALVSHEVGHNWGAGHCNGTPACDIMNSALGGAPSTFGLNATNQIIGPGAPLYSCISPNPGVGTDCNHNGICDAVDIAEGNAIDNNGTGLPDSCEPIYNLTQGTYYSRIRPALFDANSGDTIIVAPGTYHESVDLRGKNLIFRSAGGPIVTAIDVTGLGTAGVVLTSGRIEGFTIRGASGGVVYSNAGGGIEVPSGTPMIRQCVLRDNILPNGFLGGGVFVHNGASPTIQNSVFCNNSPQNIWGPYTNGGGISFPASCPAFVACLTDHGDVNGDGVVNGRDVTSFIECHLSGSTSFGDCDCADIVADGSINAVDVQAFVGLLVSF